MPAAGHILTLPRWTESPSAASSRLRTRRTCPPRLRFDFVDLLPAWMPTHYHRPTATITISQAWWRTRSADARWGMLTEAIAEHVCARGTISDTHAVASRLRQMPDLGALMARVGLLRAEDGIWIDALAATAEPDW